MKLEVNTEFLGALYDSPKSFIESTDYSHNVRVFLKRLFGDDYLLILQHKQFTTIKKIYNYWHRHLLNESDEDFASFDDWFKSLSYTTDDPYDEYLWAFQCMTMIVTVLNDGDIYKRDFDTGWVIEANKATSSYKPCMCNMNTHIPHLVFRAKEDCEFVIKQYPDVLDHLFIDSRI